MSAVDVAVGLAGLVLALVAPGFLLARAVSPDTDRFLRALVVGVGLSLAITIVVGSVLGFAGLFARDPLVASLGAVTVVLAVAAWRRGGLTRASFTREGRDLGDAAEAALLRRLRDASARAEAAKARGDLAAAADAEAQARDLATLLRGLGR